MYFMVIRLTSGDASWVDFHTTTDDSAIQLFLRDHFTHQRAKATRDVMRFNRECNLETYKCGEQVRPWCRIERRNREHGGTYSAQFELGCGIHHFNQRRARGNE